MIIQLDELIDDLGRQGKTTGSTSVAVREPASPHAEQHDHGPSDYLRLRTVLLIEDERALNASLAMRMDHAGLNVVCAYDGLEGLQKIHLEDPDAIVLDLGLPGLHGFKLLHRLRNIPTLGEAPILVVTGNPDPAIERRAAGYGVRKVLRKPVRQRIVVESVLDMLEGIE